MAALATILYDKGNEIIGYDDDKNITHTMNGLTKRNISIMYENNYKLEPGTIVIHSSALKKDHVEMKRCIDAGLKLYSYYEAVGILSKEHKTICVSGCHGKTSTSSLISHILKNTVGATYIVGDGTGNLDKTSELLILESCEYERHFLRYDPYISIITNIELDHVDYFKDIDDVKEAYVKLIENTKEKVLVCIDDPVGSSLKSEKIVFYGEAEEAYFKAKNIIETNKGMIFDFYQDNKFVKTFDLEIFGHHNLKNTIAAISLCLMLNIDVEKIYEQIKTNQCAKRRFNEQVSKNYVLIDDYAHHPTEVDAVIKAVKQKYQGYKIIAFFQGHTFSRIKAFYKEFAETFKQVDDVILIKLATARESKENYPNVSMSLIQELLPASSLEENYNYQKIISNQKTVILFLSPSSMETYINKVKEEINK